jgi:lipopolysaccharide export system permease protein
MRISTTLSSYIGRQFLFAFLAALLLFLGLILMFDVVELLRRASSRPSVSFPMVMEMAFSKLPHMGQTMFPFAVLFGGMAAFWRLTRHHELVVTRAAGVSAWQFLLPVLVVAALLGLFRVGAVTPLASAMLSHFERMEATLLKGQRSALALSESGLWLRQSNEGGQSVVHAASVLQQGSEVELTGVIIFVYEGADRFAGRIDARWARLEEGFWHLKDAWVYSPEEAPRPEPEMWFETDLTLSRIQDSFAPPETMSFWDLPGFIDTLEKAGFSAVRHRLYLHSLLAAPLLLCAMVLIAATFTLRLTMRSGAAHVIAAGVLTGFLLYFFSDIVFALGLSGSIPVTLAAWTPSGVSTLLGLAMLLHLEDG